MEFKAAQTVVSVDWRIGYSLARDGMELKAAQPAMDDLVRILLTNIKLNLIKSSYIALWLLVGIGATTFVLCSLYFPSPRRNFQIKR